jgi:hypothetical protein
VYLDFNFLIIIIIIIRTVMVLIAAFRELTQGKIFLRERRVVLPWRIEET